MLTFHPEGPYLSSLSSHAATPAFMGRFLKPPRSNSFRALATRRCVRPDAFDTPFPFLLLTALATSKDGKDGNIDCAGIHGEGRDAFPMPLQYRGAATGEQGIWIRYCYEGGKLARDGRLQRLAPVRGNTVDVKRILDSLERSGVDYNRFAPHAWDSELGAWAPMQSGMYLNLEEHDGPKRIDVKMFRVHQHRGENALPCQDETNFTIGIVGCKAQSNIGTLWRGAYQMGADEVFVIGSRFRSESKKKRNDKMLRIKQNRGHVMTGDESVPLREYADWNEFSESMPQACSLVAIEMGGTALQDFAHPAHAIYLLGSEDNGLPESVLRACDYHVSLPSVRATDADLLAQVRAASFNVAVAGTIVLYDRVTKLNCPSELVHGRHRPV